MVAVKGMKMPKSCIECLLFDDEYGDCNVYGESKADVTEKRAKNCPLVEIITCKDCSIGKRERSYSGKYCTYTGRITEDDFYCADGKRKE